MTPEQANMLLQQLISYFKGQPAPADLSLYRRLLTRSKYVPAVKAVHAATRRLAWPTLQELSNDIEYGCPVPPPRPTTEYRPVERPGAVPAEEGAEWARTVRRELRAKATGPSCTAAADRGTERCGASPNPSNGTS